VSTTTRHALLTLAVTAVAGVLVVAPGSGFAEAARSGTASVQINNVQADGKQLRFVLTMTGLPDSGIVDPASIRVSLAGQSMAAKATTTPGSTDTSDAPAKGVAPVEREAMLVLDASGSMKGGRLAAAKAAALSYAQALPSDVLVGLVTFADRPTLALPPTADRAALRVALSGVAARGGTALYDAIPVAEAAFDEQSARRRMLILSDGADSASNRGLAAATESLSGSDTGVDAVGIGMSSEQRTVLRQITAAGSGRVLPTSGLDQLSSAFVRAAATFRQQVTVTAEVPTRLSGQRVTLTATLEADGQELTATSRTQLASLTAIPTTEHSAASGLPHFTTVTPPFLLLVLTFLGMLGLGLLLVWRPRSAQGRRERLDQLNSYQWSAPTDAASSVTSAEGRMAGLALSLVNRLIRSGRSRSRIAADLERAGMRMPPQAWILLRICSGIALIAAVTLVTRSLPIGLLLGSLLGWLGTRVFLKVKAGRRGSAFADQLPDVLQLIASSLRSGFSLPQALDGVVREGPQPAASEFARALTESRLGVELEDALDSGAERMKCQDLAWVVMAVRISKDVGGNLAEVLLTTVHTMRERAQLKRQIRALSAEGRLSAYVLIGLPIFVTAWFMLVRPDYLRPLYTVPAGIMMLVIAVVGLVVGSWWMSRIVKVEA